MPAYLIAEVDVTNTTAYEEYKKLAPAAIAKYGGRYLVRGGASETLEGPAMTRRLVVLQFDSMEQARSFYNSPEYGAARAKRANAATARFVIVEGL
jgi:uncharacterized protein (DUF1330 family)